MSRVKLCVAALALAAVVQAGPALAADEAWTLKAATGRIAFHPEVSQSLGIRVDVNAPADNKGYLVTAFEAAGRLELRAPGQLFRDIGGGELRIASTGVVHLGTTDVALTKLRLFGCPKNGVFSALNNSPRNCSFQVSRSAKSLSAARSVFAVAGPLIKPRPPLP